MQLLCNSKICCQSRSWSQKYEQQAEVDLHRKYFIKFHKIGFEWKREFWREKQWSGDCCRFVLLHFLRRFTRKKRQPYRYSWNERLNTLDNGGLRNRRRFSYMVNATKFSSTLELMYCPLRYYSGQNRGLVVVMADMDNRPKPNANQTLVYGYCTAMLRAPWIPLYEAEEIWCIFWT